MVTDNVHSHSHAPATSSAVHTHFHGEGGHAHSHGAIDPEIASSERGVWAVKWSFVGLMLTAIVQATVFWLSGSIALLADLIHNLGDAVTAIPLGIAFLMARRQPTRCFAYGYGRGEDLAGVAIVGLILLSAIVTGYESIERFMHPQPLEHLGALAIAAVVGFAGNEAIAWFRIRIGKEIGSAALIADGYHAAADGIVSLAVAASALGVWLGYPWVDAAMGLLITGILLKIVWESGRTIFTRLLDGVEPTTIDAIEQAVEHVSGVEGIEYVRARWLGHRLHAEVSVTVDPTLSVMAGEAIAVEVRSHLQTHVPHIAQTIVQIQPQISSPVVSDD